MRIVVRRRSVIATPRPLGALGAARSIVTVAVPVPTPRFVMSLVVAVSVTTPSGSVTPERDALPLASSATGPAPSITGAPAPTVYVNVTVPLGIGWLSPVTRTVSVPCQPLMPVSASCRQPGVVDPLGHKIWPEVGVVNVTAGADPTVTLHGTLANVVRLPAGSVSVAVT